MTAAKLIAWLQRRRPLAPFQRRFLRGAFRPGVYTGILSGPRGIGKSSLSADILSAHMDPEGPLHRPGEESILLASSLDQARITFRFLRELLPGKDFRWSDSGQRVAVTHVSSGTRVRVASSDAKRAFGLGAGTPVIVGDEPAAWHERGGSLMYDALSTSGGKDDTKLILIGTRAPGDADGWWRTLLDTEDDPGTYVQIHEAPVDEEGIVIDPFRWSTIRRALPLLDFNPYLRPKLAEELRKAKRDPVAERRFLTYRLNRPVHAPASVLFSVTDWLKIENRVVGEARGRPIAGVDCGSTRSWSTACLLWPSGRLDALGSMPGNPIPEEQERRDGRRAGSYQELIDAGLMQVDGDRRVVDVPAFVQRVLTFSPRVIICDYFRLPQVLDAVRGRCPVVARRTRWSESTFDIQATRRLGLDGVLSGVPRARKMYRLALSESAVEDEDGSARVVKARGKRSRDDLTMALTLACGALARSPKRGRPRVSIVKGAA